MKLLAKTFEACTQAGLPDDETHGLDFEQVHVLWAVAGRDRDVSYLVSPDELPAQMPPRWYPSSAFNPSDVIASPYWAVRSPAQFTLGYDSMSWDWIVGDPYLVLPPDRLMRLIEVEAEAMVDFRSHALVAASLESKWAARARVDAISSVLTSNEVVEALALIEAREFELFEQFMEEVDTTRK